MRIAYLAYSVIPSRIANSIHVMKMCEAFALQGHDVCLFTQRRDREGEPGVKDPFAFYGIKPVFSLEKLPWPRIRFRSVINSIFLAKKVLAWKADLIYSRYLPGCAILGLFGKESVFETHSPIWHTGLFSEAVLRILTRFGRVRKLVVISEALKKAYVSRGITPREGFILARDAADIPVQIISKSFPGTGARLQVGYVGQLYEGKGMEIISVIAPLLPHFDFQIIGGFEKDVEIWKTRVQSGNIHFHGFVEPAEIGGYIKAMDVCLLPNQKTVYTASMREKRAFVNISEYTSPLKLFEYMAHGRAIVCSDLPVLREVLDGSMALFADPEKPGEWVKALKMLENSELRAKLGISVFKTFSDRHTWNTRATQLLEVIMVPTRF